MDTKNEELIENCRIVWQTVERDVNGKLRSPELLKHALQCSGRNPSDKAINHYWSIYGGSISYEQFSEIMHKEKRTTMADLMKAFKKIDLNGDGFISHDELYKVLTKRGEKLTHEQVQAIIDDADYNKDGKLNYAEFCHVLLSTAAECQAINKRKIRSRNSSHANKSSTAVDKGNTTATSVMHTQGGSMHHDDKSFLTVDKKIVQASLVNAEDNRDSVAITKPLRDGATIGTRQSLSSKAKQQKHGHRSLTDSSVDDKRAQSTDNGPSAFKQNVTTELEHFGSNENETVVPSAFDSKSVSNSSEVLTKVASDNDKFKAEVTDSSKIKNKPVEYDDGSENEVEEDLDESSNVGDSILQQLPLSSTPASVAGTAGPQAKITTLAEQNGSQLFISKLPAISKATLPPLTLPQTATDLPVSIATSTAVTGDIITSTVTSTVSNMVATTVTTATTNGINIASTPDKPVIKTKPLSNKDAKPFNIVSRSVSKNGNDMEQNDEKESSHDKLVTVTPLTHSISSELSGTLSDDSMPVTPTESIDVSESDNDGGSIDRTVDELLANLQPDHLKSAERLKQQQQDEQDTPTVQLADRGKKQPPSSAVYQKPPKIPSNLESWYTISGKGCFYIKKIKDSHISDEQDYNIVCQQYGLSLPQATCVFIEIQVVEPGDELCDVALFVFKSDSTNDTPTDFVTFTEHQVEKRFVCKLDLDAGSYILVPFTTGCRMKPRDDDTGSRDPVSLLTPDSSNLTPDCVKAITEIFHRIDLDDNGFISRQELDLFQEHTSGEMCDDDAWKVIQDNFDQNSDDEITLKGFLDLHLMTAQDTSGGKEVELLNIIQAMGYNNELKLDEACPFSFNVHTETCEGEIIVMETQPFVSLVNPVLCQLAIMRGVADPVKGEETNEQVILYTYNSLYHTSLVIENKKERKVSVQLDCSNSLNFLCNRESCVQVLEVPPNSSILGFHLIPNDPKDEWKPVCCVELILTQ